MNTTFVMKKKLPNQKFRKLVPKLRTKEIYNPKEKGEINWKKYNLAQTKEATKIFEEIKILVDSCKIKHINNLGRKGKDEKILAKIILVCELMQFPGNPSFKEAILQIIPRLMNSMVVEMKKNSKA